MTQKTITVLVVDDNPTNLNVLFDYLKSSGFKTLIAENGEEAICHAERALPDIILMDIMMPGLDGFETCHRLKQNQLTMHIPVIFMTALYETQNIIRGFNVGGVDYITKPFQQEEVLARIKKELMIQQQKKELMTLNTQLTQLNETLRRLNQTKDKFFSIIAHDLREGFSTLFECSRIIAQSSSKPTDGNIIQTLSQEMMISSQNTFRLMENLLYWARIQMATIDYNPTPIDLYALFPKTFQTNTPLPVQNDLNQQDINLDDTHEHALDHLSVLKYKAQRKDIQLTHSIEPQTMVIADIQMVDVILRNLISNAVKFSNPKDHITISSKTQDNNVMVLIKDSGIGMPSEVLDIIFNIDSKYKRIGTSGEQGSCLGLIICKELIEKQNGQIGIESKENQGTTVWFTLPKG